MKELINCWVELPGNCCFSYNKPFISGRHVLFEGGEEVLIKSIEEHERDEYYTIYEIQFKTKDKEGIWYGLIGGSSRFDKLKIISKKHKKVRRLA